jgi:hypothetical protein
MLDVPTPRSFQGASLWRNLQQGRPWEDTAIAECVFGCTNPFREQDRLGARLLSARNGRHKLILRIEPGALEELYDLEADPKEERPMAPATQNKLRGQLLHVARTHMHKTSDERGTVRLKALLRDIRIELQSTSRAGVS